MTSNRLQGVAKTPLLQPGHSRANSLASDRMTNPVNLTKGQRIADAVASAMGSWRFISIQSTVLLIWIGLNLTAEARPWDPYPFILLNLALSFQAAYAAPFIMMSQNRQQDIDRASATRDHDINIRVSVMIKQ